MERTCRTRLLALLLGTCAMGLVQTAHADWIQTVGLGVKSSALGGAMAARSDDFDAFYTNPAGAAHFERPFVGAAAKLFDSRGLTFRDSSGHHDPRKTTREFDLAIVPAMGGYVPAGNGLVLGIGFGAPFAISGVWDRSGGIHRFNMVDQSLIVTELVPTVAYRVNDWLSLGLGLNVVTFKHLRTGTLFGDDYLAPLGVPADADTDPDGTIRLETDSGMWLPVPPFDDFDVSFREAGLTLGAEFRPMDGVRLGVTYKSEIPVRFEGTAKTNITGTWLRDDYHLDMDMPSHLQGGVAVDVIPDRLTLSADVQWTKWSNAKGIGSTASVEFEKGTILGLSGLKVNWDGNDTVALRFGAEYRYDDNLSLLAGYVYDPSIFPDHSIDILSYSSDRHIFSLGLAYDATDPQTGTGLRIDVGAQFIYYESRTLRPGESRNLGGLSSLALAAPGYVGFVANTDRFRYGGYLWTLGVQARWTF